MVGKLTIIVMPRHSFRGMRRSMPRIVIQSFKKVINHAPASRTVTTTHVFNIMAGVDSVTVGQTGPTDVNVPTGSVIDFVEIQFSISQLVTQAAYFWATIQRVHSGQNFQSGRVIGGNPQRNQVHRQLQFLVGKDQNSNHIWKWKVPRKYSRVREGDVWALTIESDVVHNSAVQHIYKFKR